MTCALCKVLFTSRQNCLGIIIIYFLYCLSNYIIADAYNEGEKNSSLKQNCLVGIFISCIVCQIITEQRIFSGKKRWESSSQWSKLEDLITP